MRWWMLFLAVNAVAQTYTFEPAHPVQGQALKIYAPSEAVAARLHGKTIRLFPQADGRSFGLMPIGVLTRPGPCRLEWLDAHDAPLHEQMLTVGSAHFKTQNVVLSKALTELHSTSDERAKVAAFLHTVSAARFWQEPFLAPIPGCLTSPFGVTRLHNGKPTGDYHAGLDQRGAFGTPVHAIASGVVKIAEPFELRGGTVALDHGQGLESIYLHLSRFAVKPGDQVKQGDVIGYVGSTGRSTAPHLHWTLYAAGDPINPMQWINPIPPCAVAAKRPRSQR